MSNEAEWIEAFKSKQLGREAIESLDKVFFTEHTRLEDAILRACYQNSCFTIERDYFKKRREKEKPILKQTPKQRKKINDLLRFLKKDKNLSMQIGRIFFHLLHEKGIDICIDETKVPFYSFNQPHFEQLIELVLETYSESLEKLTEPNFMNSIQSNRVLMNIDYSKDLTNNKRDPDAEISLLYTLTLMIENWLHPDKIENRSTHRVSLVQWGDQLLRQRWKEEDKRPPKFMYFKVVANFVNAALDREFGQEDINDKLKKLLDNHPDICYTPIYLLDD